MLFALLNSCAARLTCDLDSIKYRGESVIPILIESLPMRGGLEELALRSQTTNL